MISLGLQSCDKTNFSFQDLLDALKSDGMKASL